MDSFIIFVHIIAGTVLVSMSAIMQLIIGPAVTSLPENKDKSAFQDKLKKRRIPVMDTAIVVQIITAMYLLRSRWNMIITEPVMRVKVVFGIIALTLAFMAHFYYRNKKNKLQAAGNKVEITAINQKTRIIEKVVLVCGSVAFFLGIYFNHM